MRFSVAMSGKISSILASSWANEFCVNSVCRSRGAEMPRCSSWARKSLIASASV
ncbi:Uncharacterised protein [Vibrio cholerae]|nr:Uncharacterised protein [Vibrio cholerae]